jgi:hypothetical protein
MIAHAVDLMEELVRAGFATATTKRLRAGSYAMEVTRVKIAEPGRRC